MSDVFDILRTKSLPDGESRQFCPACSSDRRKRDERTLAVNNFGDRVTYHCWHCDAQGAVRLERGGHLRAMNSPAPVRAPAKPIAKDDVWDITEAGFQFFEARGISRAVVTWAGIKSSTVRGQPAVAYPYYDGAGSVVTGYKVRSITRGPDGKRLTRIAGNIGTLFLQEKIGNYGVALLTNAIDQEQYELPEDLEGPLALPVLDSNLAKISYDKLSRAPARAGEETSVNTTPGARDEIIICEGEDDALSGVEAGLQNVTSVPHGAINPTKGGPSDDNAKLAFVTDYPQLWEPIQRVILATDGDGPGRALMTELARRLGRWRAYMVEWPEDCKDANDVLVKFGAETVAEVIRGAQPSTIPGLYEAGAFRADVDRLRRGESGVGVSSGFPSLDPYFKVGPGLLTVVTGVPKSGKSEFVDQFHVNLAEQLGWRTVIFSAENPTALHISKLQEKRARARFFQHMQNPMSDEAMEESWGFVQEHFKFLGRGSGPDTIESILERFSAAVARWGCKAAIIDPYNYISKSSEGREDLQISEMLGKARDWAQAHECHLTFVAHPKTIEKPGLVVNGHHISGGITWFAKCDFGLTVHRKDPMSQVHVWAARHAHMGQNGMAEIRYDTSTATFSDADTFTDVDVIENYRRFEPDGYGFDD